MQRFESARRLSALKTKPNCKAGVPLERPLGASLLEKIAFRRFFFRHANKAEALGPGVQVNFLIIGNVFILNHMSNYHGKRENTSKISFKAELFNIGSWTIIRLPPDATATLPSRGMALVEGTINEVPFQAVLDPDGKGGHWFRVDKTLSETAKAVAGDTAELTIEPSKNWPEPTVPADLETSLATAPQAYALWMDITPMARWDWIRWIGSAKQPETRRRRIAAACDKLKKGERRPCCFNRNLCTEPSVSHNGVLLPAPPSPYNNPDSRKDEGR